MFKFAYLYTYASWKKRNVFAVVGLDFDKIAGDTKGWESLFPGWTNVWITLAHWNFIQVKYTVA